MLFLLVCGGAIFWGLGNVLQKHFLSTKKVHEDVVVVATMLGASTTSFLAEFLINGFPKVSPEFWGPFAITATLNVFMVYFSVKAKKLEDVSVVVPLAATMPVFVIFMSWLILGEVPTYWGKIGIVVVSVGSYVLMLRDGEVPLPNMFVRTLPKSWHEPVRFYCMPWFRIASSRGAQLALLTAYLGSISSNFDKLATLHASPMIFTGGAFGTVAFFIFIWSKMKTGENSWDAQSKEYFWHLFFLGALMGAYTSVINAAYYFAIVPYVGTLKRTQIFWTVIFSGLLLGEKNTGLKLIGAAIIFVGSVLIAF